MGLFDLLQTPVAVITGIIAIVGGIYAAWRWGWDLLRKGWHWLIRHKPKVPRETVRIVPSIRECWWAHGSVAKVPAIQSLFRGSVTNVIDRPVFILRAYIQRPRTEAGMVLIREVDGRVFGRNAIPHGATTDFSADFWIIPPIRKDGEELKATIVLVDQFGNEHKVRGVRFRGPEPPKPKATGPREESLHTISDSVEKEVVSVLKAEANRYKQCGRRVGGLGSVETTYRERTMVGVGSDWRQADSPKEQAIILDTDAANIESDNADALIELHERLTEEERPRFVSAAKIRLSKDTEYAPVGYLILFVLLQTGHLSEALSTAKANLEGDGEYGFSEFLRLLDGFLRFKHPIFTTEMLDEIERFLEGIEEHTFGIRERLVAIRAHRLRKTK